MATSENDLQPFEMNKAAGNGKLDAQVLKYATELLNFVEVKLRTYMSKDGKAGTANPFVRLHLLKKAVLKSAREPSAGRWLFARGISTRWGPTDAAGRSSPIRIVDGEDVCGNYGDRRIPR